MKKTAHTTLVEIASLAAMQTTNIYSDFEAELNSPHPTENLFRPLDGRLYPFQKYFPSLTLLNKMAVVSPEIKNFVTQPNYPSIALQSYHQDDYQVGIYKKFGTGESWQNLRKDLLFFVKQQKQTSSPYLSFWAVFESEDFSEADFEAALWIELSMLTTEADRATNWAQSISRESQDPSFRISLSGTDFFVRGLHSQSSHLGRRFAYPTLIFNVFDQTEQIDRPLPEPHSFV